LEKFEWPVDSVLPVDSVVPAEVGMQLGTQ